MKIVQFSIFLFILVFFDIIKLSEQREGAVRKITNKIKDVFISSSKTNGSDRSRSKKIDRTRSSRKKKEDRKIEGDCSICMEELGSKKISKLLPCKHGLHLKCLDDLKKNGSNKCPVCRANVDTGAPEGAPTPLPRTNSAPAHLARNGQNNSWNQSGGSFPAELRTHSPVEWQPTQWAGGDGFESDDEQLARELHAQEFGRSEGMVHQTPMPHYIGQPPPQFHQMPMPHYGVQPPPQFQLIRGQPLPPLVRPIQMAHYGGPPAAQFQHNAPYHYDGYDPNDFRVRDLNPGSGYNAGDMAIDVISGLFNGAVRLGSALLSAGTQNNDHNQQNYNGRQFSRSTSYRYR